VAAVLLVPDHLSSILGTTRGLLRATRLVLFLSLLWRPVGRSP